MEQHGHKLIVMCGFNFFCSSVITRGWRATYLWSKCVSSRSDSTLDKEKGSPPPHPTACTRVGSGGRTKVIKVENAEEAQLSVISGVTKSAVNLKWGHLGGDWKDVVTWFCRAYIVSLCRTYTLWLMGKSIYLWSSRSHHLPRKSNTTESRCSCLTELLLKIWPTCPLFFLHNIS